MLSFVLDRDPWCLIIVPAVERVQNLLALCQNADLAHHLLGLLLAVQEVRDVSSTCRARMRWLEAAAEQSGRRLEALFRELQLSAPLPSYRNLVQVRWRGRCWPRRQHDGAGCSSGAGVLLPCSLAVEWLCVSGGSCGGG